MEEQERVQCEQMLRNLTEKKHVLFVQRGNVAIRLALKLVKHLGLNKVLLQDQGGWITYRQFCQKEKLEYSDIKTDFGIVELETIKHYSGCVLLINSMPAYAALQKMRELSRICMKQNNFIINDASGSIGTEEAKYGDLILGSFGIDKPVNINGHGGFIATDSKKYYDFLEKNNLPFEIDFKVLLGRLNNLNKRICELKELRNKLISQLQSTEFADKIIHREKKGYGDGINLIVSYDSEKQKEKLIKLAEKENLGFTLCPRDIRVNVSAVSFEIKRR
jgi:hypothetical protein